MRGLIRMKEMLKSVKFVRNLSNNYFETPIGSYLVLNYKQHQKFVPINYCQKLKYSSTLSETENQAKEDYIFDESDFSSITNGDPEKERLLKIAQYEFSLLREEFGKAPSKINLEQWTTLLKLKSSSQREKYFLFLYKKERRRKAGLKKKEEKKKLSQEKEKEDTPFKLMDNSTYIRIYKSTLKNLKTLRLVTAHLYSQHIVFDCSYDDYMSELNKHFCGDQLSACLLENRDHIMPFNINLCNVREGSDVMKNVHQNFSFISLPDSILMNIHYKSYLNLYPKKNLVYLTPHAKDELLTINPSDIYIIGAFVDRGVGGKISLGKAKAEHLRMAKLPLDRYLKWQKGTKSLPINIVLRILLDMRLYNNWDKALRHIPARCIKE